MGDYSAPCSGRTEWVLYSVQVRREDGELPVGKMSKPKSLDVYRIELYMSVAEFAKYVGISIQTYYGITRGVRPRWSTMRRVAERLGVHPSEIAEFAAVGQVDQAEDADSVG